MTDQSHLILNYVHHVQKAPHPVSISQLALYSAATGTGFDPWRTQPVLAVSSEGQVISVKSTSGLSAPLNQSKRQLQPALRAAGKLSHADLEETPPYCWPQPEEGAPNWLEQALKMPTPPPGMAISKWLLPRSPPVLVVWTIMVLPWTGPDLKVSLLVDG